ncbi:MAG: hypothetical protein KatS3mg087_1619 [Patescibacteria group bacterium]|nr:MAG: hypothetical protein KatS3mg087_1619 [Patescibacteria group bacterium]
MRLWLTFLLVLIPSIAFAGIDFEGLNGGDYCVYNGSESDFDPSSSVSFAFWVYNPPGNDWTLIAKRDESTTGEAAFHLGIGVNWLGFYTDNPPTQNSGVQWACQTSGATLPENQWHYVVVSFQWNGTATACSGDFKVWINGSSVSTTNWFGTGDFSPAPNTPENLYIGAMHDNGTTGDGIEEFDGILKNVAVWINHFFTDAEADFLYQGRFNALTPLQVAPNNLRALTLLPDVVEGINADGKVFKNYAPGYADFTCYDGANNTGLTSISDEHASYP